MAMRRPRRPLGWPASSAELYVTCDPPTAKAMPLASYSKTPTLPAGELLIAQCGIPTCLRTVGRLAFSIHSRARGFIERLSFLEDRPEKEIVQLDAAVDLFGRSD